MFVNLGFFEKASSVTQGQGTLPLPVISNPSNSTITVFAGRHKSHHVADFFNKYIKKSQNTFNDSPGK